MAEGGIIIVIFSWNLHPHLLFLLSDENTTIIVSLDMVSLKHPVYYDSEYMDSYIMLGEQTV